MRYYGINGEVLNWISAWLTQRNQRVCVDSEMSGTKPVRSGVPQGTVLGPLGFLLYINDIGDIMFQYSTVCWWFPALSNRQQHRILSTAQNLVNSTESCQQLQNDLTRLVEWSKQWQMTFHPEKCFTPRVTKTRNAVIYNYKMMGHQLETVHHYPYLGVELSDDMNWDPHISKDQQGTRIPKEKLN
jgi:hypothetical protein